MKAFVITISGNTRSMQAAARCQSSARMFDIEVERHEACTPADKPADFLKGRGISPDNFDEVYSRHQNCMAAFSSHFSLWERCAISNEEFLILEHDAYFVNGIPKNLNYLHVMTVGKPSYGNFQTPPMIGVNPLTHKRYFGGAHAYLVKPSGAWNLIETAQRGYAKPTDVFLCKEHFPWLQEYYPWPVEARDNFSTIQNMNGCVAKHQFNRETYRLENVG